MIYKYDGNFSERNETEVLNRKVKKELIENYLKQPMFESKIRVDQEDLVKRLYNERIDNHKKKSSVKENKKYRFEEDVRKESQQMDKIERATTRGGMQMISYDW